MQGEIVQAELQVKLNFYMKSEHYCEHTLKQGHILEAARSHMKHISLVALAQTRGVFSVGAAEGERGHTRLYPWLTHYTHGDQDSSVPARTSVSRSSRECYAVLSDGPESTESLHSDRLCAGTGEAGDSRCLGTAAGAGGAPAGGTPRRAPTRSEIAGSPSTPVLRRSGRQRKPPDRYSP
ncbi:hypothetical protein HPB50_029316 [Hyalomma asiaticum]|nr:hypothetical protein HPB50_029316 [Hyalomma asiaticum]